MAGPYYLSLVTSADSTFDEDFAREDEYPRSWRITQDERGHASLQLVIPRPELDLLNPSRNTYCWLSMADGSAITPLFFGRIIALPTNPQAQFVTVEFVAKPPNYGAAKEAVAATLRALPYFDYAFVDPQSWLDPDAVLEARTDIWHTDRVTHEVTITSIIEGEDGTISVNASDIRDEPNISYGETPVSRVNLAMRAMWTQQVSGTIDATDAILAAFGTNNAITSYTGQGLYTAWPKTGDSLGGIYTFGTQTIKVADGKNVPKAKTKVRVQPQDPTTDASINFNFGVAVGSGGPYTLTYSLPGTTDAVPTIDAVFRMWAFNISSMINYAYQVPTTEDIMVAVVSDVQEMVNDDGETEAETITISSGEIQSPVGPPGGPLEIPCSKTQSEYFATTRGMQSYEFGLAHCRAMLMRRARAVQITVRVPFQKAADATLRKSATIHHPSIPGGQATGKISALEFGVDGASGAEYGVITISCLVGKNTTFATADGLPTYASATAMGPDYQVFVGAVRSGLEGKVFYEPPNSENNVTTGGPDGVPAVADVTVTGTASEQESVLQGGQPFESINAACDAVNAIYTKVTLTMADITVENRHRTYTPLAVNVPIPTGVNLGGL